MKRYNFVFIFFIFIFFFTESIAEENNMVLNLKDLANKYELKLYIYIWNFNLLTDHVLDEKSLKNRDYDYKVEINSHELSIFKDKLNEFELKINSLTPVDPDTLNFTYLYCEFRKIIKKTGNSPFSSNNNREEEVGDESFYNLNYSNNIEREDILITFSFWGKYIKVNENYFLFDQFFKDFLVPFIPNGVKEISDDF